jgi:hypothetical protein
VTPRGAVAPSGELATHDPHALLRWCEVQRFTGALQFSSADLRGEIPLLAGVPEIAGEGDPVNDQLERFLGLGEGSYTLVPMLPPLVGADFVSETELGGDLAAVHIGDLMHYCEVTGLSGRLTLRHLPQDEAGDQGERGDLGGRACVAQYSRGELASLTLDGHADADIASVFEWTAGDWRIATQPVFGADPGSQAPEGEHLLRTLEVAITDILEKSARSRTTSWRPPTLRPPREAALVEALPPVAPLPPNAADTTVKVYFVQSVRPSGVAAPVAAPAVAPGVQVPTTTTLTAAPAPEPAVQPPAPAAPLAVTTPPPRPTHLGRPTREEIALGAVLALALVAAAAILLGLVLRA